MAQCQSASIRADESRWRAAKTNRLFGSLYWRLATRLVRYYHNNSCFDQAKDIAECILSTSEGMYGPSMLPWAALVVHNLHSLGDHNSATKLVTRVKAFVWKPEVATHLVEMWEELLCQNTRDICSHFDVNFASSIASERQSYFSRTFRRSVRRWNPTIRREYETHLPCDEWR